MNMNMYEIVEDYLKNEKIGAIATVISRDGSAPRDVGAKMFIGEEGKIYGTIGGGNLEHSVYKQALSTMGTEKPEMIHIRMDSKEVASDGMICGGNIDVLLEPVHLKNIELYRRLGELKRMGLNGVLVTQFDGENYLKTVIEENAEISGDPISEEDKNAFLKHMRSTDLQFEDGVIVESLHIAPSLYVFGAGHVSQFISKIAKMVGFYVVIIDDRAEFASRERFPDADEVLVESFYDVFNRLNFTGSEYVVIVTRGHQFDRDVLIESLKKNAKYIGMIGSRRKVKMVLEHMKEIGLDPEAVDNVYSPIGLSINAETPQEIAVSIVGELVKVRRS
ncbi:XdhC/CoxI family protein [Methanobacterium sp.]|uniref:XdhC family protein n=1 Tax=Methanobacterium sp. TaxID=2164 RepID=UPI0031587FF7